MVTLSMIVLTGVFCIGVARAGQVLAAGIAMCVLALLLFSVLYVSLKKRFTLIKGTKQYIIDAKRQAYFGNWETAATKLRIAARISPVPIENLGLDESVLTWVRQAARLNLRASEGRSFYV